MRAVEVTEEFVDWCPWCEEVVDETHTIYECGNCGNRFSKEDEGTHRCPECGKFAQKETDNGCPDCHEETEEREMWSCECGKYWGTEEQALACLECVADIREEEQAGR